MTTYTANDIILDGRNATSTDGLYTKWANPGDNSGSYVRVSPDHAGRPANTNGSGHYSIYLPYPGDAPAHIVAEARSFSAAVDAAIEARNISHRELEVAAATTAQAQEIERVAVLTRQAAATGKAVLVRQYTTGCDGSAYECDMDFVAEYAQPDGRITVRRSHAH